MTTKHASPKSPPPDKRVGPNVDTLKLEPILSLPPEQFKAALSEKDFEDSGILKRPLSEEDAKGLLALERSGQNRTDYVKMLMARLDVDSPYEVTDAGPAWTNDTTRITQL